MTNNKHAATEDFVAGIHELTARYIKDRLERAMKGDEPLPPAELGAIIKFLKDNGVECTANDMQKKFGKIIEFGSPNFDEAIEEAYG